MKMGLRNLTRLERLLKKSSRSFSTSATRCQNEYILRSATASLEKPQIDFGKYSLDAAAKHGTKTFMVDAMSGERLLYNELIDRSQRWAGILQDLRTDDGSLPTVGLFMANNLEFPNLYFGCMVTGAVVSPINPVYTAGEVAYQLENSGSKILVVDGGREKTAIKALGILEKKTGRKLKLFVVGESYEGHSNLKSLLRDETKPFASDMEVPLDAVAAMPYSSGTTGLPKGVLVSNEAMTSCINMVTHSDYRAPHNLDTPEVIVSMLPYYHIYGMILQSIGINRGAVMVNFSHFDKDFLIKSLEQHKPTMFPTVPPILKFLLHSPEVTKDHLKSISTVTCAAAPVPQAAVGLFKKKVDRDIFFAEAFGMTEVLVSHFTPYSNQKVGFCGQLLPNVMAKIADVSTGEILPPNVKGELLLKTPCMMKGYHNNPKATAETIDEDGWIHTGDIALYDENGYFSIVDRMKELIKVKGLQVSPSELEDVLLQHPAIADVGVVGVPDERSGEVPRAYIIPKPGQTPTETQVNDFMKKNLSAHKQLLGGVKFVSELPKNLSGKLLRRILKDIAMQECK